MDMNESETRQQIIDQKLKLAGWNVSDPSQVIQELDIVLKNADQVVSEYLMTVTSTMKKRLLNQRI